jgi:hypothetical protein
LPASDDGLEFETIVDGDVTWRVERAFLTSTWNCIWGRGCLGILDEPAEHLGQGCCSQGAELDGVDEARLISAMAAMVPTELFQHHREAAGAGVFSDESATNTRIVDGACIFLNRPGFAGGAGCALHLAALRAGESPMEWKPSVCWQLPIKVDWADAGDGGEVATLRRWQRRDWGDHGTTMAWCCTEGDRAYTGDRPVIDSLADELTDLVGETVFVELRRRLAT